MTSFGRIGDKPISNTPSQLVRALDLSAANSCSSLDIASCFKIGRATFEGLQHHPEITTAADTTLSTSLQTLNLAAALTEEKVQSLNAHGHDMFIAMDKYLSTGERPNDPSSFAGIVVDQIAQRMPEVDEKSSDFIKLATPSDGAAHIYKRMLALLSYIVHNEADTGLGRHACNMANVIVRNTASVLIPTFVRQGIGYGVEAALQAGNASLAARYALAGVASTLPLILNAIGLIRENVQGTATPISNISRALGLLASVAAISAAGATGVLPALAAPLIAINSYCLMREAVQAVLKLKDNTQTLQAPAIAGAAGCYGLIQSGVELGMSQLASPSGPGAASLVAYTEVISNDLIRAVLNHLGETVDEVIRGKIQHSLENKPMRITLETNTPTPEDIINAITRQLAARGGLFCNTTLLAAAVSTVTENLGGLAGEAAGAAIGGLILCVGYPLFPGSVMTQKTPQEGLKGAKSGAHPHIV